MNHVHVLHIVPGLGPGGMELGMANVISRLSGDGMRHSVVCLKGEPVITDRLPKSTDIHCLRSHPNELKLPLRLGQLIRRLRPTVIHARNWGAWPDTAAARMLGGRRLPLVLSFHGLGKADYMPLRRRLASWVMARVATRLFAVSSQSRDLMIAKWGWPAHKTEVISNGVDTERFRPIEQRPNRQRIVIGTVGNLRPVKNHAVLVQACGELVGRGVELELRIAGEGEERENLVSHAESLEMGDRIRLPGRVDDVPGFLQGLDVFVLSSDSEQHPNALNEAMACGLPCVATRVGCVAELLDDGRCGKIVPPGDCEQMAQAIDELVTDGELRRRFGAAVRQRACEHYSLERMLSAYADLYSRLSRNGRSPHA